MPLPVSFYGVNQGSRFVKGIPRQLFYPAVAILQTDSNFCSKLYGSTGFTSNNGAYMRLVQVNDAVLYSVATRLIHGGLLTD